MSKTPRLMPDEPRLFRAHVVGSRRVSPSFQRVTITSPELEQFEWRGLDHWFRLFFPLGDSELRLPDVQGRGWWQSYQAIPEPERPYLSNYTVAGYRRLDGAGELDIDVVLHWHRGRLTGVADWAVSAAPGSPVAILDQGVLFDPPADASGYLLVSDETGLPALRGILRDLPPDAVGTAIIEVPKADDAVELSAPPGVTVRVVCRNEESDQVGTCALRELSAVCGQACPRSYAFVVGESTLATGGRRVLNVNGIPKERITFSGFWRARRAAATN